jgi:S-adenosylmethionine synthetase
MIGGEVTSEADINVEKVVCDLYKEIGYDDHLEVMVNIEKQSPDIAIGVETGGAGDQGIMYGYATNETPEFMPRAVVLAHGLTSRLAFLRRNHPDFGWLRPDGKSQVTIDGGRVKTALVSTQHDEKIAPAEMREALITHLFEPVLGDIGSMEILINPTGRFVLGGFAADTGLTGRKIMVDTYGGLLPHGGGAFSGKDPTKVDRSAAYMCRFVAKNLVANGYAKSCLVSVAYAIGRAEPVMIMAKTGEGKFLDDLVKKNFDFRPRAIIERLHLKAPIYRETAAYGHFGRVGFPWEEIIKI